MTERRGEGRGRKVPVWSVAFRPPDETRTFQARMPSSAEGMWFEGTFEVTVSWNGTGVAARSRALARIQRELIRVAAEVSAGFALGDRGTAEADIACAVAEMKGVHEEAVREVAVSVTLTVDDEDMALDRERERVGPHNEVRKALHQARMERVRELRRDVLSDPQIARVWWYEQNPNLLHDIEEAGAALDAMATPAGEAEETEGGRADDPVLDAFLSGLEEWEVAPVLEKLATLLEGFERRDLVERLRNRWPQD